MITPRELVGRPALVSSYLVPVVFIVGTTVAGLLWSGYDPVRQTISELAAVDAPTRVFTTTVFVLAGLGHLVTVSFARGIAPVGRVAYLIGALASLAVAVFPLPAGGGRSAAHNTSAIIGFVLLAAWPLLGMRRRPEYPWLVRPLGAVLGTVILTAFCLWFLVVWTEPTASALARASDVGLVERLAAGAESIWPAIVVTAQWRRARRLRPADVAARI